MQRASFLTRLRFSYAFTLLQMILRRDSVLPSSLAVERATRRSLRVARNAKGLHHAR